MAEQHQRATDVVPRGTGNRIDGPALLPYQHQEAIDALSQRTPNSIRGPPMRPPGGMGPVTPRGLAGYDGAGSGGGAGHRGGGEGGFGGRQMSSVGLG